MYILKSKLLTKPLESFSYYYYNSFHFIIPFRDFYRKFITEVDFTFPRISKYTLWKKNRQQRISTIYFWQLLTNHALNTISFNSYIHKKYQIFSFF